jgi:hypothetical protein
MICPGCQRTERLSWDRYLSSPLGIHRCHYCAATFRLRHSVRYYATITALWLVCGLAPGILSLRFGASIPEALAVFWLCGIACLLPADRHIDDTWRGTVLSKPGITSGS